MASPLDPLAAKLTAQVLSFVIPAAIISGLIKLFKKDMENWIVKMLRGVFHPQTKPVQAKQEDLFLDAPPACPRCRNPMVKRMAKKGLKADSRFWGCAQFPSCRGTRSMN